MPVKSVNSQLLRVVRLIQKNPGFTSSQLHALGQFTMTVRSLRALLSTAKNLGYIKFDGYKSKIGDEYKWYPKEEECQLTTTITEDQTLKDTL